MKQIALSVEQMKYLEELGLDISDASMYYSGGSSNHMKLLPKIGDKKLHPGSIPAYTIQDIIPKLPYRIHYKNGEYEKDYILRICYCCVFYEEDIEIVDTESLIGFYYASKEENPYNSGSMVNAFYDMLVWCIKNGYIKNSITNGEDN